MNHDDLLDRINQGTPQRDPWQEFKDYEPDKEYQDFEKGRGHRRYEFLVPVSGLIAKIKGLFRGEKT